VNKAATEGAAWSITDQTAESFAATFETTFSAWSGMKARSARHAGPGERQHHQYLLDLWHRGAPYASSTSAPSMPSRHYQSVALELANSGFA